MASYHEFVKHGYYRTSILRYDTLQTDYCGVLSWICKRQQCLLHDMNSAVK